MHFRQHFRPELHKTRNTILFVLLAGLVAIGAAIKGQSIWNRLRAHSLPESSPRAVRLTWSASPSHQTIGYNVYRSSASGSGYRMLNEKPVTELSYVDRSISNQQTYYYVVTAVDGKGNESGYSKEIQIKAP